MKLWRGVAVDGIDENKIEDHLEKQGITSMQDVGLRKVRPLLLKMRVQNTGPLSMRREDDLLSGMPDFRGSADFRGF